MIYPKNLWISENGENMFMDISPTVKESGNFSFKTAEYEFNLKDIDTSCLSHLYNYEIVAFIFNAEELETALSTNAYENLVIHHKDFNHENNHYSNLEWITEEEHKKKHEEFMKEVNEWNLKILQN